jgi:protein-arginine kinase activator protein McsA
MDNLEKIEKLEKEFQRLIALERFDEAQMVKTQIEIEKGFSDENISRR